MNGGAGGFRAVGNKVAALVGGVGRHRGCVHLAKDRKSRVNFDSFP